MGALDLSVVHPTRGDAIVCTIRDQISREEAEQLLLQIKRAFPDNPCVIEWGDHTHLRLGGDELLEAARRVLREVDSWNGRPVVGLTFQEAIERLRVASE